MSGSVGDANSPNSVKARGIPLHSVANARMGFQQPNKLVSKGNHSIQRLSRVSYPRMEQETSNTNEPKHRKCLSSTYISKLDNQLLEDASIPETQKLRMVASWAELFHATSVVGDNLQETGKSTLDYDTVVQKSSGEDAINKNADDLETKLLHAHVLNPFITSENSSARAERCTPAFLCCNTSPPPCNSSARATKPEREGRDIMLSTKISEECEVEDEMHSSTREASSLNAHNVCKLDDSCTITVDLHKNKTFFWPPLSDSSDEEFADVKIDCLKLPESKEHTSPLNNNALFEAENIKPINLPVLEGRHSFTKNSDICQKWNPGTEKLLEIKEHKCKDFMWTLKPKASSGTNVVGEATDRNIPFHLKVKKDALRDRISDFQPLKKGVDQKNAFKSEPMLGMDKTLERKNITEQQANSTSNGNDCSREERETEFKFLMKDPDVQIKSFCGNTLLNPSENSTSVCLNHSYKNTYLGSSSDCVLLDILLQVTDSVEHKSNTVPIYVHGDRHENISEGVAKSVVGSKKNTEDFLVPRIKADGDETLFWNNKSQFDPNHSDSVLAKYYFYLSYLNKSKRLQQEVGGNLLSCQQHFGISKEAKISALDYHKGGNMYAHKATEYTNNDLSYCEDKSSEVIKQQSLPEKQESKSSFSCNSPEHLSNLLSVEKKQLENGHILKGKKLSGAMKISIDAVGPKRCSKRSITACASFTQRELKPRSQYTQRPAQTSERTRKGSYKSQSRPSSGCNPCKQSSMHSISETTVPCKDQKKTSNNQNTRKSFLKNANAWTELRQEHETAVKEYDEINMEWHSDSKLLPWLLLPDELWLCIFSLLTQKDITQVSQVCQRFYRLAGDESFWKEIHLTNCHCLNDEWLISLGSHHPQCFTLDHCHDEAQRITDVGLKQFFQHCGESLKELNIKSCSGPGFRGNKVLLHASTFCHNLTTVDISWTGATDSGLIALVTSSIRLQCLSANGCRITDDAVTALIEKHGKSLKKLEIFGCHALTDKCLRSVAVKCPDLEVLNIGRIHKITEECLVKVVNSMKKLTSVNLTGLNMVRDHVVHLIVKKCPKLECLVLNSCSQVTDISLLEISVGLPTIRYLDVSGCKEITDIGVQALAGRCRKLSFLDLSSTATSKRGVSLLASFCFRTLECVKLSFCKNISLDAVVKLCKNCKRLKILHLYGCHFVPDLDSIKRINKNVEVLHDLTATKLSSE
ncbi:uncharacterized protein LOC118076759 isoform X2 [Zootoca vivipara]|uniref:uncharacterized protein LOC118076759 isoform X2 n=1 Tax=Zootoca vivipara TaxID=8524 RepID=UPI00159152B1|nr:uncharacterized protein LOC118076759 isoform X2 [Zootoca vivipara]